MSKLHSDTDTAVRSEAKRARSELTRCGWGRLNTKHTRIRSFCRSCRTGDTPVNRNYGTIARKWLNVFFLRSVPLESFGTCVKAAAPQRPSESIQPVLEKKEA